MIDVISLKEKIALFHCTLNYNTKIVIGSLLDQVGPIGRVCVNQQLLIETQTKAAAQWITQIYDLIFPQTKNVIT